MGSFPCSTCMLFITMIQTAQLHVTSAVTIGCSTNPCQNRGYCVDTANGYTCKCGSGYTGINCEIEINECISSPCHHGASCVDMINGYVCVCNVGFTGNNCEIDINDCVNAPCKNGGTCVDGVNRYTCKCPYGFRGYQCEIRVDVDECVSSPCLHGGTCTDGYFTYSCQCTDNYKGVHCQTACHSTKTDIVMLLDSSGSLGRTNFQKIKDFAASLVNSFDIGPTKVQMSVVTFSTTTHPQFQLDQYQNPSSLLQAINAIPYQAGTTHTSEAIDYLIKHSFTLQNGDRLDAPNIAVIITDGQSSDRSATIQEASLLHQHGVTTVAIAIGSGVNVNELNAIASNRSLVFQVPNFDALHNLHGLIDHDICKVHLAHTQTTAYPTPPNIVPARCEDKVLNCYQYGFNACQQYRQWASQNCPKFCLFCSVPGVSVPTTPGPVIFGFGTPLGLFRRT